MDKIKYTAMVAVDRNYLLGFHHSDGGYTLPWPIGYIIGDLTEFRRRTVGHTIIMGRNTYDSLENPLPDRNTVVFSNCDSLPDPTIFQTSFLSDDEIRNNKVHLVKSFSETDRVARILGGDKYVIGGADLLDLFAKHNMLNNIILTRLDEDMSDYGKNIAHIYLPERIKEKIGKNWHNAKLVANLNQAQILDIPLDDLVELQ